jgi:deoxyribodipyrimidine photo-lyase
MIDNKRHKKALFIFRRDLRLDDNTALLNALKSSKTLIPCFIFDPRQIECSNNEYKSNNALQFMIESLYDLEEQILSLGKSIDNNVFCRLYLFYGEQENVVSELLIKEKINAVFTNKDYTPFSKKRDYNIGKSCHECNVEFYQYSDYLLSEPRLISDNHGRPITVYSKFLKKVTNNPIRLPERLSNYYDNNGNNSFYNKPIESAISEEGKQEGQRFYSGILDGKLNEHSYVKGGRKNCLKILADLKKFENYGKERCYPAKQQTTKLSAHIKFGTCSIREAFYAIKDQLGIEHILIKQLYWRDFFTYIAYHFPYVFGEPFNKKYENKIKWNKNGISLFTAWCNGKTGFPIVDAGMRQLNKTGFMPNRLRMVAASFLTNDLKIDWRLGEKYFAQKLVDYDPCVNNGWWQWFASTGCNTQRYLRAINPWMQQRKIDPDCMYIKEWVEELEHLSPDSINNLDNQRPLDLLDYPYPVITHP